MKKTTMKKVLVAVAAVGALAVPGGMALAQNDTPAPAEPVATCEPERDRDRDRVNDRGQLVVQAQDRVQLRLHDGTCDGDCTGDQVRDRDQVHLEDGTGPATQGRRGEMGDFGNGRGNS